MNLKKERQKRGLTMEQMANLLKCSIGSIYAWETRGINDYITAEGIKAILKKQ